MTPGPAQRRGARAEHRALRFLRRRGLRLVARNFACRHGEIDLIMTDRDTVVFVEVRMRADAGYGGAAASVTGQKQARIARTAQRFMQRHASFAELPARFDVVAIRGDEGIDWLRGAFDYSGAT